MPREGAAQCQGGAARERFVDDKSGGMLVAQAAGCWSTALTVIGNVRLAATGSNNICVLSSPDGCAVLGLRNSWDGARLLKVGRK